MKVIRDMPPRRAYQLGFKWEGVPGSIMTIRSDPVSVSFTVQKMMALAGHDDALACIRSVTYPSEKFVPGVPGAMWVWDGVATFGRFVDIKKGDVIEVEAVIPSGGKIQVVLFGVAE